MRYNTKVKKKQGEKGLIDLLGLTASEWFWLILILMALISMIKGYMDANDLSFTDLLPFLQAFVDFWLWIEPWLRLLALLAIMLLVYGIIYANRQTAKLYKRASERVNPEPPDPLDVYSNKKWERVLSHIASPNESDWKLAILEADIMLDEMTSRQGFEGDTLGEKLKSVDRSDFNTIDLAWEAHKVRNAVAHQGAEYRITSAEAQRVIRLYEQVFNEFKYI